MSPLKQIAVVAGIIVAAAVLWFAPIGRTPAPDSSEAPVTDGAGGGVETAPAVPVIVTPVRLEENSATVRAVGTGEAIRTVTLYPRAAGEVVEVGFEPGQKVEAGQPIIRLDDAEEELAVRLAQVRISDARQLLQRYERAVRGGGVSATEVDNARTTLEEARIQLAQAELALERRTVVAPFSGVVGF